MDTLYRHFVPLSLLVVCALIGAAGQYLLKTGASLSSHQMHFWTVWFHPATIVGLAFYFIAALLYISVLKTVPLSIAYPTIGLNTLFVAIIGRIFFKEQLSFTQVGGLLFLE